VGGGGGGGGGGSRHEMEEIISLASEWQNATKQRFYQH
jgi:hypothetical protein